MKRARVLALAVLTAACSGTVPPRDADPARGFAAVLIGSRLSTPDGPARGGAITIDLETKDGGPGALVYRLPLRADDAALFRVEPGVYGLAPTRGFFGATRPDLVVRVEDRVYRLPFPRELMRPTYDAKPRRLAVVGVLVAQVMTALPGQAPQVRVSLEDSAPERRELIQRMIRETMDPNTPASVRDSTVSWMRELQRELVSVLAEPERKPLYQTAP